MQTIQLKIKNPDVFNQLIMFLNQLNTEDIEVFIKTDDVVEETSKRHSAEDQTEAATIERNLEEALKSFIKS